MIKTIIACTILFYGLGVLLTKTFLKLHNEFSPLTRERKLSNYYLLGSWVSAIYIMYVEHTQEPKNMIVNDSAEFIDECS